MRLIKPKGICSHAMAKTLHGTRLTIIYGRLNIDLNFPKEKIELRFFFNPFRVMHLCATPGVSPSLPLFISPTNCVAL